MRMRLATLLVMLITSTAVAQTPPAPAPQPTPPPPANGDAVLDEQIAQQLVDRAQELLDAKLWLDAKQLAVEALVKSPKGPSADKARYVIRVVNQHLNIKEDPAPTPPSQVPPAVTTTPPPPPANGVPNVGDQVDMTPIDSSRPRPFDPSRDAPPPETPEVASGNPRTAAMVHGAFYGGVIGATIGAFAAQNHPAAGAVPLGIGLGVAGGFGSRVLVKKLGWDVAQTRTAGSFMQWGGVIGGLFGEAVTGAGTEDKPTARGVLLGGSIGATAGLALGAAYAKKHKMSRGDVALVDTLAGIGAVGGLTVGMLMQPKQPEAYSVNAIIGVSAGIVVGVVAGPQTNTTERRMLRVAGLSAAGGAIPFLLYAAIYDSNSKADERVVGLLASAGLIGGAYLGFHLTRGMDAGLDVSPGSEKTDDAPPALVGRNSSGSWRVGGLGLAPVKNSRGATLTLVGATF